MTGKPIIISSEMSSWEEMDVTLKFLEPYGNDISILQCTTAYPTLPGQWGLSIIKEIKKRYDKTVGYSDHSGKIHPMIAAAALGAEIIEFHAVFDKQMFGPDAKASLNLNEINQLITALRELNVDFNSKITKHNDDELIKLKNIFEKSLSVNRDMQAGEIIRFEDLEAKKPKGFGIDSIHFESIIGRKIKVIKEI